MGEMLERMNLRRIHVRASVHWQSQALVRGVAEEEGLAVARDEREAELVVIVVGCAAELRAIDRPQGRRLVVATRDMCEGAVREWGACGAVGPTASLPMIVEAMHRTLDGGPFFYDGRRDGPAPELDGRDVEILRGLIEGEAHDRIAMRLEMTRSGLEKRLSKLRERFEAPTTEALVAKVVGAGLV